MTPVYTFNQVGYGAVAKIHRAKFESIGAQAVGICDTSLKRCQDAALSGYQAFQKIADAHQLKPDFWDVCVSTADHLKVIKEILNDDPVAKILVEKPICTFREAQDVRQLIQHSSASVTVNETYCSSNVIRLIKKLMDKLQLVPDKITVEMSKDRRDDILEGRFVDQDLGVLGYEGSHMLAVLQLLGDDYLPSVIQSVVWEDMGLVRQQGNVEQLPRQGSVDIRYIAQNNTHVTLFSSMTGEVRHPFLLLSPGEGNRQRLISVEGIDRKGEVVKLVGMFEPIRGLGRGCGAIAIFKENQLQRLICPIEDDHMQSHLLRVKRFLQGKGPNPCSVDQALRVVYWLQQFSHHETSAEAQHQAGCLPAVA